MSAKNKKGLGRGFESLIPTELFDDSFDPTHEEDSKISKLVELPISDITPDESQPRRHFDEEALNELAASIKNYGVLSPIVVVKKSGNTYQIVAGERRWRASKIAGQKKIPAIVRSFDGQKRLEVSLIENVQRKDLNILEVATAYAKLRDQFNMTSDEIGKKIGGKSEKAVSNTMRLLKLPEIVKKAVFENGLTEGQVRPLLKADEKIIEQVLPKIIEENWSARKVEQFMVQVKKKEISTGTSKELKGKIMPYESETKRFESKLGSRVTIRTSTRGSGQIVIKFKDDKDFKRQMDILLGKS